MGTSALLSASLGIPTILAPLVYTKKIISLRFDWIHNYDGYTLGEISDQNILTNPNDLNSLFQEAYDNYEALSFESSHYVRRHHDISSISSHLLSLLSSSSLKYDNPLLTRLTQKSIFYKVYYYLHRLFSN